MINKNILLSIKGINKRIGGEVMKRSLAILVATSMMVGLSACSKQPAMYVDRTGVDVSAYNKDIENFVNIVYNGKMADTSYIDQGQRDELVKMYNDTNDSLQSSVDINDKMQVYMTYLEYQINNYRDNKVYQAEEAAGDSAGNGDYVDSRTPEQLQSEVELGEKVSAINQEIEQSKSITDNAELLTKVHKIWEEYNSLPDNGKNHVNIDVVAGIINTYGNMTDGFDLNAALAAINPENRGHSFEASPEEEKGAGETEGQTEGQTEIQTGTGVEPTVSISKNYTIKLMARNDFGTGSKDSSITYNYIDIPEDWYKTAIGSDNTVDVNKIKDKVAGVDSSINYKDGRFSLDLSKLAVGLNLIDFPGGYTLEVVKPEILSDLAGMEDYHYSLKDFIYWDNNTFKVNVVSKMGSVVLTGTDYNGVIVFDDLSGILPHSGDLTVDWHIETKEGQ